MKEAEFRDVRSGHLFWRRFDAGEWRLSIRLVCDVQDDYDKGLNAVTLDSGFAYRCKPEEKILLSKGSEVKLTGGSH